MGRAHVRTRKKENHPDNFEIFSIIGPLIQDLSRVKTDVTRVKYLGQKKSEVYFVLS